MTNFQFLLNLFSLHFHFSNFPILFQALPFDVLQVRLNLSFILFIVSNRFINLYHLRLVRRYSIFVLCNIASHSIDGGIDIIDCISILYLILLVLLVTRKRIFNFLQVHMLLQFGLMSLKFLNCSLKLGNRLI